MKNKDTTYFILLYALVILILFSAYIFDKGMAFGKALAH
jgi:hypothetical protein